MHDPKYLAPDSFGVPYFEAIIKNRKEYGVCPVCGLEVPRAPAGSFGTHWEFAVSVENALRDMENAGLIS